MSCAPPIRGSIPCPSTIEQHHRIAVNLLPKGFAWTAAGREGTVMYGYWRAVARTFKWFTDQACLMTNEFFCSTRDVLAPDYDREFNLPDPCAAFMSPCDFRIVDRARCVDLVEILAERGWSVSCGVIDANSTIGCAAAGCSVSNDEVLPPRLVITVDTDASPIFTPSFSSAAGLAVAGCSITGCENVGPGTISGLRCVIDQFLPAHMGYNLVVTP